MAVQPKELFSNTTKNSYPRIRPAADGAAPKRFDGVAGAPPLLVGTPVAYDTSVNLWVKMDDAGSNGANIIRGFVYPDDIELHASNETIGSVMIKGTIHRDDVIDHNTDTPQSAAGDPGVDGALAGGEGTPTPEELGLIVQGLKDVR